MKRQKGFSLIEVIVSIAAIALASSIILQLFLVASYRNERGKRTDMAVLYAQGMLEAFKRSKSPNDIMDTMLMGAWEQGSGGYRAEASFSDGTFSALEPGKAIFGVEATLTQKNTGHDTSLPLNIDGTGGNVVSSIHRLTIRVSSFRGDGSKDELFTMGADNLFTYLEAAQ